MSGRPPLHGFNTNYRRDGTLYHVQTEDLGEITAAIVSQVYTGGTILAMRRTEYREILDDEDAISHIQRLMQRQHKEMLVGLRDGSLELGAVSGDIESLEARPIVSRDTVQMEIPPDFIDAPNPEGFFLTFEAEEELPPEVSRGDGQATISEPAELNLIIDESPVPRIIMDPLEEESLKELDSGEFFEWVETASPSPLPVGTVRSSGSLEESFSTDSAQISLPPRARTSSIPVMLQDGGHELSFRAAYPRKPPSRAPKIFSEVSHPARGLGEEREEADQLGERSLDEVILSYLAEELQKDS